MQLDEALKKTAVLGACGKMGQGIAHLLLLEMARLDVISSGKAGSGSKEDDQEASCIT